MSRREPALYLQDILTSLSRIEDYTEEDLIPLKEQIEKIMKERGI